MMINKKSRIGRIGRSIRLIRADGKRRTSMAIVRTGLNRYFYIYKNIYFFLPPNANITTTIQSG